MSFFEKYFNEELETQEDVQASIGFTITTDKGTLSSSNSSLFITNIEGAGVPEQNFEFAYYPALGSYGPKNTNLYAQREVSVTFKDFSAALSGSKQAYSLASHYSGYFNSGSQAKLSVKIDDTEKYVEGWISSVEFPYFEEDFSFTVKLLCADPYWYRDKKFSGSGSAYRAVFTDNFDTEIPSPASIKITPSSSFDSGTVIINDVTDNDLNITSTAEKTFELRYSMGEYKLYFDGAEVSLSAVRSPFEFFYYNSVNWAVVARASGIIGYYGSCNFEITLHSRSMSLI